MNSEPYVLGGTQVEQQRLVAQAQAFEPQARWLLDHVPVKPGWRALDVGCGPIGILNLLSERVGAKGSAVGLEREPRFAEMARAEIAKRGLSNVTIIQADALDCKLPKDSFDLVHERLVIVCFPKREALLSQMVSLVRPGGTVILEDIDNVSWVCWPPHSSWDLLLETFHRLFHANGGNGFIGRRLPEMLRTAGLKDVRVKVHVDTAAPGEYRRTHLVSLLDSIREKVIAVGLLTEKDLDDHIEALTKHLEKPETVVIDKLLVQAWGQKAP